jgi:hypothetical protein
MNQSTRFITRFAIIRSNAADDKMAFSNGDHDSEIERTETVGVKNRKLWLYVVSGPNLEPLPLADRSLHFELILQTRRKPISSFPPNQHLVDCELFEWLFGWNARLQWAVNDSMTGHRCPYPCRYVFITSIAVVYDPGTDETPWRCNGLSL